MASGYEELARAVTEALSQSKTPLSEELLNRIQEGLMAYRDLEERYKMAMDALEDC